MKIKARFTLRPLLVLVAIICVACAKQRRIENDRWEHANMKNALKQLIDDLDRISEEHEEVGDTDVREQMHEAVHRSFIVPQAGYVLPSEFGMFSKAGNEKVLGAIQSFLSKPEVRTAAGSLATPQTRLDAFQDMTVKSNRGRTYDEYFGYAEKP